MKRCLWIILLVSVLPLFAKDKKLGGYVIDPAAFVKIHSYCIDTHNLPPEGVSVVAHSASQASTRQGLLTMLPCIG